MPAKPRKSKKRRTLEAAQAVEHEPRQLTFSAALDITAAAEDDPKKNPKVSLIAYNGGLMKVGWGSPVVVDLAGLQAAPPVPLLADHYQTVDSVLGTISSVSIAEGQVTAAGEMIPVTPRAKNVVAAAKAGYRWKCSIGLSVGEESFVAAGESVEVNGQKFTGPLYVARHSTLNEISIVPIAADAQSAANIAAKNKESIMPPKKKATTEEKPVEAGQGADDKSVTATKPAEDKPLEAAAQPSTPPAAAPPADLAAETVSNLRASAAAEVERINGIRTLCAEGHSQIEAKAISEGWDSARTELEILRASRPTGPAIHGGDGASSFSRDSLTAALCMTAGMPENRVGEWFSDNTMEAALDRNHRGVGIHTVMYETIRAAGRYVRPGSIDNEVILAALESDRTLTAAGGFSSISLSGILGAVANKQLLQAYLAVPAVAPQVCGTTDAVDFKSFTRYRMSASGDFEKVGADGELKHGSLDEASYSNQLDTYGKMLTLTRQMMINDDLGAFLQIPKLLGRKCAIAIEKAFFTLLLANTGTFFGTGNKNYISGATTTLSSTSLGNALTKFRQQVDAAGDPIVVDPRFLLVPPELEVAALELYASVSVDNYTASGTTKVPNKNIWSNRFPPVVSPYLSNSSYTGYSTTGWYLFADPADVAAFELAFLRGQRQPTIESADTDFNTLGKQFRAYLDFGVAQADHRGAVKSKGAA